MSGRVLAQRLQAGRLRPNTIHRLGRPWPLRHYALHNVPAARSISFARAIPKLATKFATAGAAAGGAVIAGASYIQYQAGRMWKLLWSSIPCG